MSIQPNSDAQSLASSISSYYAAMESSIAFSVGIGLNRSLRSRLRAPAGASDGQAIFVSHLQKSAWLEIDPKGSVIARRQKPEGLPSIDLGQAVMREPALTSVPHEACRRTKNLQRELKHPAIFPKRCAVFVVTSPTCDDSRLIAGDLDIRSQATDFARLHFCVKTETQQSIEIAGFLILCWLRGLATPDSCDWWKALSRDW